MTNSKTIFLMIATTITLTVGFSPDVFAQPTNTIVLSTNDSTGCDAIGGIWTPSISTCEIFGLIIEKGTVIIIENGVTLSLSERPNRLSSI